MECLSRVLIEGIDWHSNADAFSTHDPKYFSWTLLTIKWILFYQKNGTGLTISLITTDHLLKGDILVKLFKNSK